MDQNFTDTLSQVLVGCIDGSAMVHEGGVRAVEVEWFAVDVAHHGPCFLEKAGGGGVIPEASPTLLRFGELEMITSIFGRAFSSAPMTNSWGFPLPTFSLRRSMAA